MTDTPVTQATIRAGIRLGLEAGAIHKAISPFDDRSPVAGVFTLALTSARQTLHNSNLHLTNDLERHLLSNGLDFDRLRNALRNGRR